MDGVQPITFITSRRQLKMHDFNIIIFEIIFFSVIQTVYTESYSCAKRNQIVVSFESETALGLLRTRFQYVYHIGNVQTIVSSKRSPRINQESDGTLSPRQFKQPDMSNLLSTEFTGGKIILTAGTKELTLHQTLSKYIFV